MLERQTKQCVSEDIPLQACLIDDVQHFYYLSSFLRAWLGVEFLERSFFRIPRSAALEDCWRTSSVRRDGAWKNSKKTRNYTLGWKKNRTEGPLGFEADTKSSERHTHTS
jgi:hypothetical protein